MRKIFLYGDLKERYGKVFEFDAESFSDAISIFQANFNDFRKTIMNSNYALVVGESIDNYITNLTGPQELDVKFSTGDFHILPETVGAGGEFVFILGALLTGVGVVIPGTSPFLLQLGVSLMLSGLAALLTPTPKGIVDKESPDQKASIVYSGGVNNVEQGGPVPLVYGRIMAGSVVVSADVSVVEYSSRQLGSPGSVSDFTGDP